nr:tail fiber protein [uncultured Draconibacterium sp.]
MDAFIGEIRAYANNYYPDGWLPCLGQKVSINDYAALFSIIQNYYGDSDMRTYFTLPDLRGRTLVGTGGQLSLLMGEKAGEERVTLNSWEIPEHAHSFAVARSSDKSFDISAPESDGTSYLTNFGYKTTPESDITAVAGYVSEEDHPVTLNPSTIGQTGGNLSHENMAPFLAINYFICSDGIYPPRP